MAYQRKNYHANRDLYRSTRKALYNKHADKRKKEAATYRAEHPEYHALAEWFRRKGIPVGSIPRDDIQALVEMKRAVKQAKDHDPKNRKHHAPMHL